MKGCIAVLAAVAATALAPSALASNNHRTLGPAGYDTPGKSALVLAGTSGVELGSGDHVVICHAIGGAKGDRFNQIAPSASGVLNGHDGHEGDRDIIPPYTYVDHKGNKNTSVAGGNNWFGANIALYNQGCGGAREGDDDDDDGDDDGDDDDGDDDDDDRGPHQQPNDVCPNIEGLQTGVPAGFVKDAAGNCICPPVTVTVNTVAQTVPQIVTQTAPPLAASAPVTTSVIERSTVKTSPKAKKKVKKKIKRAKKLKAKRKAKRGKRKVKALPRVLPFTP
jgi:hypothetical protein